MRFLALMLLMAASAAAQVSISGAVRLSGGITIGQPVSVTSLTYAQAPIDNPLKGIAGNPANGSSLANFPHSLLYVEASLRACVTASNTYSWTALDSSLQTTTNDNSQAIVRFRLDDPAGSTLIPQYVLDSGIWTTNYYGTTLSPDYTNAVLRNCLTNFIAAFGARYDGDPRIAFVEMGLLMPWGEWDTGTWTDELYAHLPPLVTMQEVAWAYTNAFRTTKLMMRYPADSSNSNGEIPMPSNANLATGYYDDAFTTKTVPTNFWPVPFQPGSLYTLTMMHRAGSTNAWKTKVIGGETYYNQGTCIFSNNACVIEGQTWSNCVFSMHASFEHVPSVFYTNTYTHGTNALWGAQILGYELYAQQFLWYSNGNPVVSVVMTNTGVAPFYYNWQIELRGLTNGTVAQTWYPPWQITSIIPGDGSVTFTHTLTNAPATPFTVLMRAVQPLSTGKQLRFANATMHQTTTNWLTLGTIN